MEVESSCYDRGNQPADITGYGKSPCYDDFCNQHPFQGCASYAGYYPPLTSSPYYDKFPTYARAVTTSAPKGCAIFPGKHHPVTCPVPRLATSHGFDNVPAYGHPVTTSAPAGYAIFPGLEYAQLCPPPVINNLPSDCTYPGCQTFPYCGHPLPDWYVKRTTMLESYRALDRYMSKNGHTVYKGNPQGDKEYLFLFCKLKGVPKYYQQVLHDKHDIQRWSMKSFREIYDTINSSNESMPESLVIAKKILAEYKVIQDTTEMLNCLKDICAEWAWQQKLLSWKKYEEYLLEFWKKNKRKPEPSEISETFCSGWTWAEPKGVGHKICTVSTCFNPGSGKPCVGLTLHAMEQLGQDFLEWLEKGGSPEEGLKTIEENYKKRSSKPYSCRANYIKAKLEEAQKTGVAKEIERLNEKFKDLVIPGLNLDLGKEGFDTSVGAPL